MPDEPTGDDAAREQRAHATAEQDLPAAPPDAGWTGESSEPLEVSTGSLVRLLTLVRADLAAAFEDDATPEQLLQQVVRVATQLIPNADDASVAVLADDRLRTVAAAGELAVALDEIQLVMQQGPSLDVARTSRTLRVADLGADARWCEFGERAAHEGVRSLLACALPLPRQRQAAVLTVYATRPAAFDVAAELVAPVFAARAAIAIAHAEKVVQLERALQTRQVIGQAVGILMERHRFSDTQAFDTLVKASQKSHVKLREVALRVAESGEEPDEAARY